MPSPLLSSTFLVLLAANLACASAAPPTEEALLALQAQARTASSHSPDVKAREPDQPGPNPKQKRHTKNEKKLQKNSLGELLTRMAARSKANANTEPVKRTEWFWSNKQLQVKDPEIPGLHKRDPYRVLPGNSKPPKVPTRFPVKDGVIQADQLTRRTAQPLGQHEANRHKARMEKTRRLHLEEKRLAAERQFLQEREGHNMMKERDGVETRAVQIPLSSTSGYWTGVSSYYLYSLLEADRLAVLDAAVAGGFKVVRIFITATGVETNGSNSIEVPDLEPNKVGEYDDTILEAIDQLMTECLSRGLKLMIALHDRYALGFWETDAYALEYGIVKANSTGGQQVVDASTFYTNSSAIAAFNSRLAHIMTHTNALLGKTWAELDNIIYAIEAQNEPQGHMPLVSSSWACDRASFVKSLLPPKSGIQLSSGGGITTQLSLGEWAMSCPSINIVSVHDYSTSPSATVSFLKYAQQTLGNKKTVILGEWGVAGSGKAALITAMVSALKSASLPWIYWQLVNPGAAANDLEIWTDEPAWQALTGQPYTSSSASSSSAGTSFSFDEPQASTTASEELGSSTSETGASPTPPTSAWNARAQSSDAEGDDW